MITQSEKVAFVTEAAKRFGEVVTRQQLVTLSEETGTKRQFWLEADQYRVGRGKYQLPLQEFNVNMAGLALVKSNPVSSMPISEPIMAPVAKAVAKMSSVARMQEGAIIPKVNSLYVPFGFFDNMKRIVASKKFYPVFVSGLSGNGKTFMVEQACAQLKVECLRVNISPETDEDDLIGGFRLIDGETKWFDGPVVQAMKSGAVLILDEIDRGSNKLMCLQGVLEAKVCSLRKLVNLLNQLQVSILSLLQTPKVKVMRLVATWPLQFLMMRSLSVSQLQLNRNILILKLKLRF